MASMASSRLGVRAPAARVGGARKAFSVVRPTVRASAAATNSNLGFKTMRDGIKEAADETLLTPRL
jgi:hypothetical protein